MSNPFMGFDQFGNPYIGGNNPTELSILKSKIDNIDKRTEFTHKKVNAIFECVKMLGHILADVPGCNTTDKQKEMWEKFRKKVKEV